MEDQNPNHEAIVWEAQEFVQHPKNFLWYLAYVLISASLIVFAVYTKSIISIVAFGLIIVLVFFFSHRKPRIIRYEVNSLGIVAGDIEYPYKTIKKFWIHYNPPHNKSLNFEVTSYVNSEKNIELGDQDPVELKEFLEQYIFEDIDKEESFTDVIARKMKL